MAEYGKLSTAHNMLRFVVMWYVMEWYGMICCLHLIVWYGMFWYTIVWYGMLSAPPGMVWYCLMRNNSLHSNGRKGEEAEQDHSHGIKGSRLGSKDVSQGIDV